MSTFVGIDPKIIQKYEKNVPRYTSYPTYDIWNKKLSFEIWSELIEKSLFLNKSENISIYIHLPYCENLCYFCGCNKIITKNHDVEIRYLQALIQEWKLYLKILPAGIKIKEMHLGGGTPTFFSAKNLNWFFEEFLSTVAVADDYDFSVEAHPGVTSISHFEVLKRFGFNRLSLGVQDINKEVQDAVGRNQTTQDIELCTNYAREFEFSSVNYDLIYGLPNQTIKTSEENFKFIEKMQPDRIAFYNYAHVPHLRPNQLKMHKIDRPLLENKFSLYSFGKSALFDLGYKELGFDHYVSKSDSMYTSFLNGHLHRNFMGYTVQKTSLLLGLGVSSISDCSFAYVQNKKNITEYFSSVASEKLGYETGYVLSDTDLLIKQHILNLSCYRKTSFLDIPLPIEIMEKINLNLSFLANDGLVCIHNHMIEVTELGVPFIRHICACFDTYLNKYVI